MVPPSPPLPLVTSSPGSLCTPHRGYRNCSPRASQEAHSAPDNPAAPHPLHPILPHPSSQLPVRGWDRGSQEDGEGESVSQWKGGTGDAQIGARTQRAGGFTPLLLPSGPRSTVHSSMTPKGSKSRSTSSSDCCLFNMPTKSFLSPRGKHRDINLL